MSCLLKFKDHRKQKESSIFWRCLKGGEIKLKLQTLCLKQRHQQNRLCRKVRNRLSRQLNLKRTFLQGYKLNLEESQFQRILLPKSFIKNQLNRLNLCIILDSRNHNQLNRKRIYSVISNLNNKTLTQWVCFLALTWMNNLKIKDLGWLLLNLKNLKIHFQKFSHLLNQSLHHLQTHFNKAWTLALGFLSIPQHFPKSQRICSVQTSTFQHHLKKIHLLSW